MLPVLCRRHDGKMDVENRHLSTFAIDLVSRSVVQSTDTNISLTQRGTQLIPCRLQWLGFRFVSYIERLRVRVYIYAVWLCR